MKVRLSTTHANALFQEHGVQLTSRWSAVDFEKLSLADRAGLVRGRNHYLQVHPDDTEKFDEEATRVKAELAACGAPAREEAQAGTRGPTIEQWVAHGYKPQQYPGMGFAEVPSAALTTFRATGKVPREAVEAALREEAAREAAWRVKDMADRERALAARENALADRENAQRFRPPAEPEKTDPEKAEKAEPEKAEPAKK